MGGALHGSCRVLLGVDGSASSLRALAYAVGTARRMDAALVAVYVQPNLPAQMSDQSAVEGFVVAQQTLVAELRREVDSSCASAGIDHAFVVRTGDPFLELTRIATASDVDAVLVGASMRMMHRILPSIASRLVRAARWPVTVVP